MNGTTTDQKLQKNKRTTFVCFLREVARQLQIQSLQCIQLLGWRIGLRSASNILKGLVVSVKSCQGVSHCNWFTIHQPRQFWLEGMVA